jgi:hypothetical protein
MEIQATNPYSRVEVYITYYYMHSNYLFCSKE